MMFLLNGILPWMKVTVNSIADQHKVLIMKQKVSINDFKYVQPPKILFDILT